MSKHPDTGNEFERLASEVERAEAALRGRFTDVPAVDPAVMQRIKVRLRAESSSRQRAAGAGHAWLRSLSAVAASILLVAGFYATMYPMERAGTHGNESGAMSSLETFTASLPGVMADEDTEITQLRGELRQLESQAVESAPEPATPGDPAAERELRARGADLVTAWSSGAISGELVS